ncbi:MAG: J domain-containing protein, partial [Thiohalocapsa sp.]|nr:J domain-containing protein [Thiohalocapsa sp.]
MSEPSRVALAQALLAERPAPVLLRQLDTLLTWLGNPDNPAVTTLDAAIKQTGQERSAAAGRAYALLDGFLFVSLSQAPATTLGLDPETNIQAAKLRYRRLIQAYHPDRHPDLASVLNDRLERINVAYAALQQGAAHPGSKGSGTGSASPGEAGRARTSKSGPSEGRGGEGGYRPHAAATTRTPKQPRRPKRAPRSKPRHHRSWVRRTLAEALRQSFGDASSFQTRFFGGLVIVCALVLALHHYQTPPPPTPAKVAD